MVEGNELPHEALEPSGGKETTSGRNFRVAALLIVVFGTIYGAVYHEKGSAVFSVSSLVMFILALVPPDDLTPRYLPRLAFRVNQQLRRRFQKSDRLVRAFMIAISIGGTALVCKYGIKGFSLFPPIVDVAVKRFGPFFAISSCVLYPMSVISKSTSFPILTVIDLSGVTNFCSMWPSCCFA